MSRSSDWKTGKCIEWRTELPNAYKSRESPTFIFQERECFFQFKREIESNGYCHHLVYLKQKEVPKYFQPFYIAVHVSSETAQCCDIDVVPQDFDYSTEYCAVWSMSESRLKTKFTPDFEKGFLLKFLFIFDSVAAPAFKSVKSERDESVQTSSPPEPDVRPCSKSSLEYLSDDLGQLLEGGGGGGRDVSLKCGEVTIEAHRAVLGARSAVFAAMLTSDMTESRTGMIELERGVMDEDLFRDFVRHLYTGKMPELSVERATKLYDVGDQYAVEGLKRSCAVFLTDHLTPDTACDCLVLADARGDPAFKESVLAYLLDSEVPLLGDRWSVFCRDQPRLAVEALNRHYRLTKARAVLRQSTRKRRKCTRNAHV